jgi:hypothetical protein
VLSWLCKEREPLIEPVDLARNWLDVRAPSRSQIKLAEALLQGFLLDYREWALWEYVGHATRQVIHMARLETWRRELAKRYAAIAQFHSVIATEFFWRSTGTQYRKFDSVAHRRYLDGGTHKLLDYASLIIAQALEAMLPNACVARFNDWLLVEGNKPKTVPTAEKIERKLVAAFPGSKFQVKIEEVV